MMPTRLVSETGSDRSFRSDDPAWRTPHISRASYGGSTGNGGGIEPIGASRRCVHRGGGG